MKHKNIQENITLNWQKNGLPYSKPQINSSLPPDIKSLAYSIFFETFRYKPKRKSQTNPYII